MNVVTPRIRTTPLLGKTAVVTRPGARTKGPSGERCSPGWELWATRVIATSDDPKVVEAREADARTGFDLLHDRVKVGNLWMHLDRITGRPDLIQRFRDSGRSIPGHPQLDFGPNYTEEHHWRRWRQQASDEQRQKTANRKLTVEDLRALREAMSHSQPFPPQNDDGSFFGADSATKVRFK
jgi:hypothetical protein